MKSIDYTRWLYYQFQIILDGQKKRNRIYTERRKKNGENRKIFTEKVIAILTVKNDCLSNIW